MRSLLIVGIVLLLCGVVITPWAFLVRSVEAVTDPYSATLEPVTNSWSISANYSAQQRLILKIAPGKDWAMYASVNGEYDMGTGMPTDVLLIHVVVTDPKGGDTKVEVVYIAYESEGQQMERTLFIFADKILSDGGGLTFEDEYIKQKVNSTILLLPPKKPLDGQFMGITKYDGRYRLTILQNESDTPNPPTSLALYKQTVKFVQPFLLVAPVGCVSIVAGGYAVAVGRKKVGRRVRTKNSNNNSKMKN